MNSTRLLTAFVLALATTTAIAAGAPPAKGAKGPGKVSPPGGATVVHEKAGAATDKTAAALGEIEHQRDRALDLLAQDRTKLLASIENERDRGLESAENDEQRAAVLATYQEKRESVMGAYATGRGEVLRDYAAKRAEILSGGGAAADAAVDDAAAGTAAAGRPAVTEPDASKPVPARPRVARTVRGDLGELEEDILQERETHEQRIESLRIARKRAKELKADDQIERIDTLIKRETDRHTEAMKSLESDHKALEKELDRRRKEEAAADEVEESDEVEDDDDGDQGKRRRADRERDRDRDRDANADRDRKRNADGRRTARDIERELNRENERFGKRMEELALAKQTALNKGDRTGAQKIDEEMRVEQRRHADVYQKLHTELATAGPDRGTADLDDPEQARHHLRRLRRRLAETDEDITTEKRRHARRTKTLEKRIEAAPQAMGEKSKLQQKLLAERERNLKATAALTSRRESTEQRLEQTRAAYGKLMRREIRVEDREQLRKSLDELEKELQKSGKAKGKSKGKGKGKNDKGS